MSRIGKLPISIPAGVTISHKDNIITVKGPKGELSQYVDPSIKVTIEDGHVSFKEDENAMIVNQSTVQAMISMSLLCIINHRIFIFFKRYMPVFNRHLN